jgi:hypothetical protein
MSQAWTPGRQDEALGRIVQAGLVGLLAGVSVAVVSRDVLLGAGAVGLVWGTVLAVMLTRMVTPDRRSRLTRRLARDAAVAVVLGGVLGFFTEAGWGAVLAGALWLADTMVAMISTSRNLDAPPTNAKMRTSHK